MIDVVELRPSNGTRSGVILDGDGWVRPHGSSGGTVRYPRIAPMGLVSYLGAELVGRYSVDAGSVRIRFFDDTDSWYIDGSSLNRVTVGDWSSQYSSPRDLDSIELWKHPELTIVVMVVPTVTDPDPMIAELHVVMEMPLSEDSAAQAVRSIAQAVAALRPVLLHEEVLSSPASTFRIGEPYSERGYVLDSLVGVTVDGRTKSASMADGIVTLLGDPAPAGSTIKIGVRYAPNTAVRRVEEIRVIEKTPFFMLTGLVQQSPGGLNGQLPPYMVGGIDIKRRFVDLRVTVRGVGHRQADALAMRAEMQATLGRGIEICLDSGRTVYATVDGLVEVIPRGNALPEAVCLVRCPLREYTSASRVVNRAVDTTISVTMDGGTLPLPPE